jgi:hypothetical protein
MMLDCRLMQDDALGVIHIKLARTMSEFGPIAADGSYPGGNFWLPTDPLGEYAVMCLSLVRVAAMELVR